MDQFKRVGFGDGSSSTSSVKASVASFASLPLSGNTINDLRYVISEETFYRWNNITWIPQKASASKYIFIFDLPTWVLSGSDYIINIPRSTHNKDVSPVVEVSELDTGQYSSVIVTKDINNNGDLTIKVPSSPDLRFSGKLTII